MYAAQQAILPTCIVSALPNAFFTVRGRTLTKCRFTVTSRSHRPSTVGEGPPSAKANAVLRGRHQRVRMPSRPVHLHVRWACVHTYAMKYGQFAPTMSAPSSSRPSAADPSVTVNRRRHGAPQFALCPPIPGARTGHTTVEKSTL